MIGETGDTHNFFFWLLLKLAGLAARLCASVCACGRVCVCECDYSRSPRAPETPISPLISLHKSVARRRRPRRAGSAELAGAPAARRRLRAPGGPRRPPSEGGPPEARRLTDAHRHGVAAAAPLGARASDRSPDLSERRGQWSRSRRDVVAGLISSEHLTVSPSLGL